MKNITLKTALAMSAVMCLCSAAWAQTATIPTIRVTAVSEPTTTTSPPNCWMNCAQIMNYVKVTRFQIEGAGNHNLDLTPEPQGESDSIRVRGNSTATAAKKPYRIKFDKKRGLFGKTPAKSWVLLANYYDHSFALNAIAFRLGQKLGFPFTPSSQFVNLYINGSYKGIYQLTEQIQVNPGRVDIDTSRGFLVEFDYHDAASDEVKFTAAQYSLGTFIKSPELAGCDANPPRDCNINQSKITWVRDSINALMNKMAEGGFPTNGYRDMIDMESWAKYVLIEQFMDNFDFNSKIQNGALPGSNYAHKDYRGKITAGPIWDFDLSAVPVSGQSFGTRYSTYQEPIKPKHTFYQRLWADPEFITAFKKVWTENQSVFTAIPAFIDSISGVLRGSVANNVCASPTNLMQQSTLNTTTYDQEISKAKNWWNSRMTFFGAEVNKLNGSVIQPGDSYTLQAARNPSAGGSVSVTIGSGSPQNNPAGQLTAAANTSVTISATPATGYTFTNWTAVSGALPSGFNASSASNTFSITANVNIRANFTGGDGGPTNHTLQVSRQTETRGSVSVTVGGGTPQSNPTNSISVAPGASVAITATPNEGCSFVNWTAGGGTQLPAGVTASSGANITFTMNANVNLVANFLRAGGGTSYTLNVGRSPEAGGSVTVNGTQNSGQQVTIQAGESVTLTAAANSGYQFLEWTGSLPPGVDKNSATVTFTISGNVNIAASFRDYLGGGSRTDTVAIIEAEDLKSSDPSNVSACPANPPGNQTMCKGTNNGITNIGYINNGNSATYLVSIARQGVYTFVFRIATAQNSTFGVTVNGVSYGTISGNTGDWDGYTYVTLPYNDVPLDAGQNTIALNFQSAVNVDYFMIIGDAQGAAVKYGVPNRAPAARTSVTLRPSPGGFSAALPSNHGYMSYRLIDMRGREVRRGKVGPGVTDLRFDGLNRGVMFLKLEGNGGTKPLVLRAVTY